MTCYNGIRVRLIIICVIVFVISIFGICNVNGVYFTMRNMKTTLPIFRNDNGRLNRSLVTHLYARGISGDTLRFRMNKENEYLEILPMSHGEIRLKNGIDKEQLRELDEISIQFSATDSNSTDENLIEIDVIPLENQDCDLLIEDLCFWTRAEYRIRENNKEGIVLGTLANPYLHKMCSEYKINYTLLNNDLNEFVILHEHGKGTENWVFQTNRSLDRDKKARKVPLSAKCSIENPQGTIREIIKNITVEILDENDNLPSPQEDKYQISMSRNIVHKGHLLEHNKLIFQDNDTIEANQYNIEILNDHLNMLKPVCKNYPISEPFERTITHCKMEFTKDVHFEHSTYPIELKLTDVTYTGNNAQKTVKVPIHIFFDNGTNHGPAAFSKPFTRNLVLYPERNVRIFRTAGPLARVTQPVGTLKSNAENFMIQQQDNNVNRIIFNVTNSEGIVFVQDHVALLKSPEYIILNMTWWKNGRKDYDEIQVRIIDEATRKCDNVDYWSYCSEFDNYDSCTSKNVCAIATGGYNSMQNRNSLGFHRCEWRGDVIPSKKITPMYSTCTPDSKTCPDGFCDSLENLNDSICPQDCTRKTLFPMTPNEKTGRGIDKASGVCICSQLGSCHCEPPKKRRRVVPTPTQTNHPQMIKNKSNITSSSYNVTISGLIGQVSKCGTFCVIGLVAGVFVIGAVVSFIVLCWRLHTVHKAVNQKFTNRPQDLVLPLSEYTRNEHENDLNIPIHFNMTTSLTNKSLMNLIKKYEPDPKWEFPRDQLEIEQTLGEGEFGRVVRAKATNINGHIGKITVAVKTLKDDAREAELNDLLSEYQLLKEVSHPNVIKLLGVCTTPGGPVYLIIEYAEFGALRNYLRRARNIRISCSARTPQNEQAEAKTSHYDEPKTCEITPKELLSFAWQICNGMSYLSSVKLVHRDLAARNVLLAAEKVCKISDFGLTRDIYEDNAYFKRSKGRVPVKWMAPESLQDHIYTTKSDVWSFGILLWELVTLGASPYPGIAVQNLFHLLKQGYRMERPNNCSEKLYKIMTSCWEILPENRPNFQEISKLLEDMLGDGIDYMDLSDNSIQNRTYFISPFENIAEISSGNKMNYLSETVPGEKCGEMEKFKPEDVEKGGNYQNTNGEINGSGSSTNNNNNKQQQGYETPIKVQKKIETPSNENPDYYTNMAKGNDMKE